MGARGAQAPPTPMNSMEIRGEEGEEEERRERRRRKGEEEEEEAAPLPVIPASATVQEISASNCSVPCAN